MHFPQISIRRMFIHYTSNCGVWCRMEIRLKIHVQINRKVCEAGGFTPEVQCVHGIKGFLMTG